MPSANYAPVFWAAVGILLPIAIVVSTTHRYTRIRPVWQMKWDDYALDFAFVSFEAVYHCSSLELLTVIAQVLTLANVSILLVFYIHTWPWRQQLCCKSTVQLLICQPLSAMWHPIPGAICLTPDQLCMYGRVCNCKANTLLAPAGDSALPIRYRAKPDFCARTAQQRAQHNSAAPLQCPFLVIILYFSHLARVLLDFLVAS